MNTSAASHDSTERLAPLAALPVGTRLQEFEVKSVIGEGGFGIVYLALDTLLGREVAIKEYLPVSHAARQADGTVVASSERQREAFEKARNSFVSEARMLARFKHSALVEILRFWEAKGTAYMVMPYYQGQSLHALIQEGFRIKDSATLEAFLAPLLDGLVQLHSVNCYHRDISSDNILMLENGSPILLDFGAARNLLVDVAQVATVILKPGFAPIEQYSEDSSNTTQGPWTDLYALSAVAYQAITGVMPTVSVARIIRDPLIPLSDMDLPGISSALRAAIDAGLRVVPHERPQSVQEFCKLMGTAAIDRRKPSTVLDGLSTQMPLANEQMQITQRIKTQQPATANPSPFVVEESPNRGLRVSVLLMVLILLALMLFAGWYWWLRDDALSSSLGEQNEPSVDNIVEETSFEDDATAETLIVDDPLDTPDTFSWTEDDAVGSESLWEDAPSIEPPPVELDEDETIEPLPPIDNTYQKIETPPVLPDNPVAPPKPPIKKPPTRQATDIPIKRDEPDIPALPQLATVYVCNSPAADIYINGELKSALSTYFKFQAEAGQQLMGEIRYASSAAYKFTIDLDPGMTYRVKDNCAN